MKLYVYIRGIVRIYFKLFYKWKITGAENIPKSGPVIVISNHTSNFDPLAVACSLERQVHFMAKEELYKVPIVGRIINNLGTFPVKRGGNDLRAVKKGLEILKSQKILGIFPEGTRSLTGEIRKGLPGAALFALKTDAKVIPVGIVSEYKWFKPLLVNIGLPISLESFKKDKVSSENLTEAIEYMMNQIKIQVDELK